MRSKYFLIRKVGPRRYLKKKMKSTVFNGNLRMMRAYKRHGREKSKTNWSKGPGTRT